MRNRVKRELASDFVSIVVPCKSIGKEILEELIPALGKQSYKNFELLVISDQEKFNGLPGFVKIFPSWPKVGPADKKDLGVKFARGKIIAFLDDDVYPDKDWLKNALKVFELSDAAAVCGPGVTPPNDPLLAKVSGWFWASFLGSGGAGTYRCWPEKRRLVDDYPTFNLLVRKSDFLTAGGFSSAFWPGEDTKLCHDLVYKLGKKIVYDPLVLVYHHRRRILLPHLRQIGRYGLHRGHFAVILPKTSRRIGYFIPSIFFLGVIFGPIFLFLFKPLFYFYVFALAVYFLLSLLTSVWVFSKSRNFFISFLLIPTFFISHMFNGLMFLRGFTKRSIKSKYSRDKV